MTTSRSLLSAYARCGAAWTCLLLGATSARAGEAVPFKESLTYVSTQGLDNFYTGHAAHLGAVNAILRFNPLFNPLGDPTDPANPFATHLKTAANGDTLYGRIIPDDLTNPFSTGTITIDGGTGRFTGVTGITRYVITFTASGHNVSVTGTMTSVGSSK